MAAERPGASAERIAMSSFGNFYLLNPVEGWAAVCIARNACTSLEAGVLQSLGRDIPAATADRHDTIGRRPSDLLRPLDEGPPPGMFTFAVWRDPVERWYSAVAHLRRADELLARRNILGRRNTLRIRVSLAQALAVTRNQLALDPLACDEHLRRQTDSCNFDALDAIVDLRGLDAFFARNGWRPLPHRNEATKKIPRNHAVTDAVRELYAADALVASRC